jgi:hypothetical protein
VSKPNLELLQRDLDELRKLQGSRGYALLTEAFHADVLSASYALADEPNMPDAEMHFRRGAIRAARTHLTLLDTLIVQKENELLLASAATQTPYQLDALA